VIGTVLRLELRRSRSLAIWLALTAFLYSAVIAGLYPVLVESMSFIEDFLKTFPEGLLSGFGVDASFSDPGVYYTSNVGIALWPILAAIAAVAIGTRVAADTERGWIELPLAGRLPRTAYLGAAIAVEMIVLAVLAAATVAGIIVGGELVGAGFDAGRFALAGVAAWIWALPVAGIATLLAVCTLSRSRSAGVVAGILVLMYLLRVVAEIEPNLGWLASLSAFDYLYPTPIIDDGVFRPADLLILGGITAAAWGGSLWAFRRRDLVA
jgi:ABC-2 type transport system permease protein